MRKVTVYYTESNSRLEMKRARRVKMPVTDEMYEAQDWTAIVKRFLSYIRTTGRVMRDSETTVTSIKIGNAHLRG